ncbi:hypothetical protein DSL92_07730 [Billgrantia gudaonensis]|uniref:Carrier domain-containing protein n=1 Tax=Billgrantia gudaonensis TaxID=376427 RepID=A0A3S0QRG2_9GAMM|nr:hypothetical protein DSL92_07730 [Halomonas gudaonensis]
MTGASLIATRIIGRLLSEHGIEVHLNDLFSHPTAAALTEHARHLSRTGRARAGWRSSAARCTGCRFAGAAVAVEGLRSLRVQPDLQHPFALRFLDCVDEAAFKRAFLDLLERHPGLRTLFHQHGGAGLAGGGAIRRGVALRVVLVFP